MLSSWTFWYSGVSGACWARPHALVGSNLMAWPPRRGLMTSHWPFQLGYFASSAALAPAVIISAAASATTTAFAPVELRSNMKSLLAFLRIALVGRDKRPTAATASRIHRRHGAGNGGLGFTPISP